jgi:hypothetical protein
MFGLCRLASDLCAVSGAARRTGLPQPALALTGAAGGAKDAVGRMPLRAVVVTSVPLAFGTAGAAGRDDPGSRAALAAGAEDATGRMGL